MAVFEFFKNFKEAPLKKKLRLPKRFVRLYGETLSNEVFLKPNQGLEIWKIGLTKSDGKVWLERGWPAFAKRYALGEGRLVLFGYEGHCEFAVSVCDNRKSTSQIYGNLNPASSDETEVQGSAKVPGLQGIHYDNAIEITDSFSLPCSDEEVGSPPLCSPARKRMRTRAGDRCEKTTARNLIASDEDSVGSNSEIKEKHERPSVRRGKKSKVQKRAQSPTPNVKDKSLQRDGGRKSVKPSFVVAMKPSYISSRMYLPLDFWKIYLNRNKANVVLYGSDGGAWTVNFSTKKYKSYRQASFVNGWKKFVQDNDLVVGDICSFELINRGKAETSFKVTISRSADQFRKLNSEDRTARLDSNRWPHCVSKLGRAREAAGKFSSRYPFFQATVPKTNYYMFLPDSFASKHFGQKPQTMWLEVGKRSWPVRLVCASRYFFIGGFVKFLLQNSLRPGDVCIFELIKANPITLKAAIFRA